MLAFFRSLAPARGTGAIIVVCGALVASGCTTKDPLFCDDTHPCTDPERPYCDRFGAYEASDHIGNTCIASPFDAGVPDAAGSDVTDAALADAATNDARSDARPNDAMPDAMPCTTLIAFLAKSTAGDIDVFTMTATGANATNLTMAPRDEAAVRWSPDGKYLAFTGDHNMNNAREAYVMAKDGSGLTNISQAATTNHSGPFSWSPDSLHVAFERFNQATVEYDIVRVDRDGSNLLNLLPTTTYFDANPEWSPNGLMIAFNRSTIGGKFQIYTMNAANGAGITPLTSDAANDAGYPRYSPSGTRISFNRAGNMYTMTTSGTAVTLVHSGSYGVWSRAGDRIAFVENGDLFTVNPDGTALINLTTGTSADVDEVSDWAIDDSALLVHVAGTPGMVGVVPAVGSTVSQLHEGYRGAAFQPMCQ